MSKTKVDSDDWLRVEHYRKINSKYGCVLCEKTHLTKDCPHKNMSKTKEEKEEHKSYNSMYAAQDSLYGW